MLVINQVQVKKSSSSQLDILNSKLDFEKLRFQMQIEKGCILDNYQTRSSQNACFCSVMCSVLCAWKSYKLG